jgi:hypothetical protein
MANGDEAIGAFETIQDYQDKGKKIPEDLRDDLMFGALVMLFKEQKKVRLELGSSKPWIDAFKWFLLIVGPAVIIGSLAFIWALLTHQFHFDNYDPTAVTSMFLLIL